LAALLAGKSPSEAAEAAGVSRVTLWRWQKDDFDFAAALNRGRLDLREAMQSRLSAIADKAAATVESAVAGGDVKSSLAILRGLGLLSGVADAIPSDDPRDLRSAAERNKMFRSFI